MNEETLKSFKYQNSIRIVPYSNITMGKVIVNGIEITSVEDWNKVTSCLTKLEHNWNELKEYINRNCVYDYDTITYEDLMNKIYELEEGGNNED